MQAEEKDTEIYPVENPEHWGRAWVGDGVERVNLIPFLRSIIERLEKVEAKNEELELKNQQLNERITKLLEHK